MRPKIGLIIGIAALVVVAGVLYALNHGAGESAPAPGVGMGAPNGAPAGGPSGGSGQFAEFQKTHRYTMQMMKLLGNIGRLEEGGKEPLSVEQAKSILAIVDPLRKQATLDETSAKKAFLALQAVLTDAQRTAISQLPAENRFRQGNRPPGPPPGGGQPSGPHSGAPFGPGAGAVKGLNPLNPPAPLGGIRAAKGPADRQGPGGFDKLFADLKSKSEGK